MSQPYSRRGLLGALSTAILGLFFGQRAKSAAAPKPLPPPVDLGTPLPSQRSSQGGPLRVVGTSLTYSTYLGGSGEPKGQGN